jgi:hypothetical protein
MATPAFTTDSVYSSYPAKFDSLLIRDVVSVNPSANVKKIVAMAGGSVDPGLIAEQYREPVVDLTALDLGTILAACSATAGLAVSTSAKIQYQLRSDGGTFDGSSNHVTLSTAKGFLHPESISAKQDEEKGAEIQLKFWPLCTSTNPPLIVNISQALTSTPNINALYRLGPVSFEGSVVGGVQSASCKFGIDYKPFRAGGQIGAFEGFIRKRAPVLEFETTNQAILAQIGFGITGLSTGFTMGFQLIGTALASSAHVKITVATGSYEVTDAGVSGEGDAMAKVTVTATGTLSVSTSSALA